MTLQTETEVRGLTKGTERLLWIDIIVKDTRCVRVDHAILLGSEGKQGSVDSRGCLGCNELVFSGTS